LYNIKIKISFSGIDFNHKENLASAKPQALAIALVALM
jgi:hypothetical protein